MLSYLVPGLLGNDRDCYQRVSGCVAPSPCRPKLHRPNLSLGLALGLARIRNRLGLGLGLGWGDKAMGRHNLQSYQWHHWLAVQITNSIKILYLLI